MTDDLAAQLAFLRKQRDAAPDAATRAMFEALIAEKEAQQRNHSQTIAGDSRTGAAVAGDVRGDVIAPLFAGEAGGNFIAGVLNLYQQAPAAPQADYGAALRRYLEHLYRQYATLDLRGIDDRPLDMPLNELYVSLRLHEPPPEELAGRGALRGFMAKVGRLFGTREAEAASEVRGASAEGVDWTQALRKPRLAVVGAPGSGKTTLLHYTAVRLAEVLARDDAEQLAALGIAGEDAPTPPPAPLFLPLRELGSFVRECNGKELAGAGPRLLLDCLANYYARFDLDLPPDFFSRLCENGRALLLLDGLDEVAASDERALVSGIVRAFVGRYQRCRYVVTSRVAAYQGDAQVGAGFRICTVADLDEAQQQRFIANWSRSLHRLLYGLQGAELERRAGRYADELQHALAGNERVGGLAANPLLLTVVAVIFYNNYVLPADRAALYEECVEVLLRGGRGKADRPAQQRRDYAGRAELKMGLDPKRAILAAVAYRMQQRGEDGLFIHRDELVREVAQALRGRYPDPNELAKSFVAELPVHIGLLDEREPERYRFSHLSFQEFLAARHIAEATEERWDELLDRYRDSWWREVILLCAGHLSQERCWRFLGRLVERGATPAERAAAQGLAADALAELERFKGHGPLNTLIQADALRILELQAASAAPAQARVECGRVLALVGDPRPGVCDLARMPFVAFAGGPFMIGNAEVEYRAIVQAEKGKPYGEYAEAWYKNAINQQATPVAPFELARYPVTNAQYQVFLNADGYNPAQPWWGTAARVWLARDDETTPDLERWQKRQYKDRPEFWDNARFGIARPNHPVVGINWYEATAFCRWLTQYLNDGFVYRLPSELEWEYAARGAARRMYAWGNQPPDAERANFDQAYNGSSAVGCFPAGATPEGLLDMNGNVWEWTRSEYRDYPYNPADGWEDGSDPAQKRFTVRGGGWAVPSLFLRASRRDYLAPVSHHYHLGIRLARHSPVKH